MIEIQDILHRHTEMCVFFCAIVGLIIGSFLNVVIYRLPRMEERDWIKSARAMLSEYGFKITGKGPDLAKDNFTLSRPPSACPACHQALKAHQNIPLISYALQAGKCANCAKPISLRYPIVELLTGILFLATAMTFGVGLQALFMMVFVSILVALSAIDFDRHQLPDSLTLPLLWIGLLANLMGLYTDISTAIIGAMAGYVSLWAIYWAYFLLRKKEAMGYGDFKLLAALGAWAGWQALPLIILLAAASGLIVGVIVLLTGRGQKIAFGPYLAFGGWLMMMWGDDIQQGFANVIGAGV